MLNITTYNYETLDEITINGKKMLLRKVLKNSEETYYKIIILDEKNHLIRSKRVNDLKKAQKYFNRKKVKGELNE